MGEIAKTGNCLLLLNFFLPETSFLSCSPKMFEFTDFPLAAAELWALEIVSKPRCVNVIYTAT